jgi:hypothetical protein
MLANTIQGLEQEIQAVRNYADQLESLLHQYKEVEAEQAEENAQFDSSLWQRVTHAETITLH